MGSYFRLQDTLVHLVQHAACTMTRTRLAELLHGFGSSTYVDLLPQSCRDHKSEHVSGVSLLCLPARPLACLSLTQDCKLNDEHSQYPMTSSPCPTRALGLVDALVHCYSDTTRGKPRIPCSHGLTHTHTIARRLRAWPAIFYSSRVDQQHSAHLYPLRHRPALRALRHSRSEFTTRSANRMLHSYRIAHGQSPGLD